LNASNADQLRVGAPATPTSVPEPPRSPAAASIPWIAGGIMLLAVLGLGVFIRKFRAPH
jgi:hypothetical protein